MRNLFIIKGGKDVAEKKKKEIREQKKEIYNNNFWFWLGGDDAKALYYGMKSVEMFRQEDVHMVNDAWEAWKTAEIVCKVLESMTYKQVMSVFPVKKDFDGWRFEAKDYYSTMEYLDGYDLDGLIENVDDFLWSYYNDTIMRFGINRLMILDCIRRLEGQQSIMQSFADEFGLDTYIMHEDKGYAYNTSTQRTAKIKSCRRRHGFKILKGGKI